MSNPNPKNKFKVGNPGGGRPKLPEEIKSIKNNTKEDILLSYYKFSLMAVDEANEYVPLNLLEAGILKCFSDFIHTGKTDQIKNIWAECHGKPKESIDIDLTGSVDTNTVININGVKSEP